MGSLMTISKEFRFEASHILPLHRGKCSRLHGHSWVLTVAIRGPLIVETGFVVDYHELKSLVDFEVIQKLDHSHLGFGEAGTNLGQIKASGLWGFDSWKPAFGTGFYPSSENLVRAIGLILNPLVQELSPGVKLYEVKLNETCTSQASWRPEDEGNSSSSSSNS